MRVGILISGRGSNMDSLLAACARPDFPAEASLVVSNNPDAPGLVKAEGAGIPALAINHRDFGKDREAHERAIDAALREAGCDLVCLAGYMRLLTPWLVEQWRDRMLNIHPALLPAFKGLDTHARALAAGVRIHGATVHIVRPEMDAGPILIQGAVPVTPQDDESALAARVLQIEHRLYPEALRLVASGAVRIDGDRVIPVDEAKTPETILINPEA